MKIVHVMQRCYKKSLKHEEKIIGGKFGQMNGENAQSNRTVYISCVRE